jgi:hypothetical protein
MTVGCSTAKTAVSTGGDINAGSGRGALAALDGTNNSASAGGNLVYPPDIQHPVKFSVTVYGICVDLSQLVVAISANDSNDGKTATATCPSGDQVTGATGASTNATVELDDIRPSGDLRSAVVQGLEGQFATPASWWVTAYAICSPPPPGLELRSATSALDSNNNKTATATCPLGKQVLGTGAQLNASNGQVVLDDVRPDAALTSVTARGLEDQDGYSGVWSVTAHAICANRPPGLELVKQSSPLDSSDKTVTASCPAEKNLVGTGGDINAGGGQVRMRVIRVDGGVAQSIPGLTNTQVFGNEGPGGTTGVWSITAYAICADP